MVFHTRTFAAFLSAVLILFFTLPRKALRGMLILASYVFYGWLAPEYTILMLASSVIDFCISLHFSETADPRRRKLGIVASALFNFGLLFYFKYANFAVTNLRFILHRFGIPDSLHFWHVALPLGISFYTFHSFSYSVDVLSGRLPPCRSLPKFILFVSWFPQLVAGPIARGESLLPQLDHIESERPNMAARLPQAAIWFSEGWLRKSFADWLALTADSFFDGDIHRATSMNAVYGIAAFGLQIYADFSGYTRMAQGVSWLFGVRLTENFNFPYAAVSPQDFWRRWHISLSSWFRDYLYIPLGGDRKGRARTYFNIVTTMVICGLWHGASWNFLVWGLAHSGYQVAERTARRVWKTVPRWVCMPVMWIFVFLAWIPFRASDLRKSWQVFTALGHGGLATVPASFVAGALGVLLCDLLVLRSRRAPQAHRALELASSGWVTLALLVWVTDGLFWQRHEVSFIYFRF